MTSTTAFHHGFVGHERLELSLARCKKPVCCIDTSDPDNPRAWVPLPIAPPARIELAPQRFQRRAQTIYAREGSRSGRRGRTFNLRVQSALHGQSCWSRISAGLEHPRRHHHQLFDCQSVGAPGIEPDLSEDDGVTVRLAHQRQHSQKRRRPPRFPGMALNLVRLRAGLPRTEGLRGASGWWPGGNPRRHTIPGRACQRARRN